MLSDSVDQRWLDLLGLDPTKENTVPCPVLRLEAVAEEATVVDVPRHLAPSRDSGQAAPLTGDDHVPLPRRVRPRKLNEIRRARRSGRTRGWRVPARLRRIWRHKKTRVLQLTTLFLAAVVVSLLGVIILR